MPDRLVDSASWHMAHHSYNYLRTHRKRSGLTQEDVAFLLELKSCQIISRYEQLTRIPSLRSALACQVVFDVAPRELFPGMYRNIEKLTIVRVELLAKRIEARHPNRTNDWKRKMLLHALERTEVRRHHI